ncbi:hypothetical protein PR048_007278 [Dryococelus australis]|uniref:HAT C-terminal dimerisation domain-containing protein n=1 Tax=Dryococelus australis TaxID=614101 RepID=A0ABQ9ID74_9NEOP|nr:hypothetical protein PR048_007278 [Dryococelus australis]
MGRITDIRTEDKFTELWEKVKKRGEDLDLQSGSLPRVRIPSKHNIQAPSSSSDKIIDGIKCEIESRYQHPGVAIYKAIENVLVKSSNGEVENITGDLNVERFTKQFAEPRREHPQIRRLFSEVCTCLKLLLVSPATSATAERTFSAALKYLKTWLRSTMTQERLNHITVLAVHWDLAKNISNLDIANTFISSKESRK